MAQENERKLCFVDIETTGTNPKEHGIIQIGGIIEIAGEEKERFNLLCAPFPDDLIEDRALQVNKRTQVEVLEFSDPKTAHRNLANILSKYVDKFDSFDKFHFVGYNANFDDAFLRAWFTKCGDNYYGSFFHWPPLDVANMAAVRFIDRRSQFPNFRLSTVTKIAGLEIDETKTHNAMYDIEITKELFYKMSERKLGEETDKEVENER